MAKKEEAIIQKTIADLFKHLSIDADFSYEMHDDVLDLALETQDSGIVIGYHGEILEALQLILSLSISQKLGSFIRVSVEVGEYRKQRTKFIENLALSAKEKVLQDHEEVPLPDLKSWERRIVHLLLQDDKEVMSESTGEGRDRRLIIKPRG